MSSGAGLKTVELSTFEAITHDLLSPDKKKDAVLKSYIDWIHANFEAIHGGRDPSSKGVGGKSYGELRKIIVCTIIKAMKTYAPSLTIQLEGLKVLDMYYYDENNVIAPVSNTPALKEVVQSPPALPPQTSPRSIQALNHFGTTIKVKEVTKRANVFNMGNHRVLRSADSVFDVAADTPPPSLNNNPLSLANTNPPKSTYLITPPLIDYSPHSNNNNNNHNQSNNNQQNPVSSPQQEESKRHVSEIVQSCQTIFQSCRSLSDIAAGEVEKMTKKDAISLAKETTRLSMDLVEKVSSGEGGEEGDVELRAALDYLANSVSALIRKCIEGILGRTQLSDEYRHDLNEHKKNVAAAIKRVLHQVNQNTATNNNVANNTNQNTGNEIRTDGESIRSSEVTIFNLREHCKEIAMETKELIGAAKNQYQQEFAGIAKGMLNHINAVVSWAKQNGLNEHESHLRSTCHDLLLAARDRLKGLCTDEQLLDTVRLVVDSIKLLLQKTMDLKLEEKAAEELNGNSFMSPRDDGNSKELIDDESSSSSSDNSEKDQKRARNRFRSIKELIVTETTYFTELKTFTVLFLDPLLKKDKMRVQLFKLHPVLDQFFTSLSSCMELTKKILGRLKDRALAWHELTPENEQNIGDIFQEVAPLLRSYRGYINIYDIVSALIEELRANKKVNEYAEFDKHIREFEKSSKNGQSLNFYLIMPIQRLPRYEMILNSILKLTSRSHPDFHSLTDATRKIKTVNDAINEFKRQEDNMRKLRKIDQILAIEHEKTNEIPGGSVVNTKRIYIREGVMYDTTRKKKKEFYYFMFNDILLRTKPAKGNAGTASYAYIETILLNKVILKDEDPDKDLLNVRFYLFENKSSMSGGSTINSKGTSIKRADGGSHKLIAGAKSFAFEWLSENEKKSWMTDLQSSIYAWHFIDVIKDDDIRDTLANCKLVEHALITLDMKQTFAALLGHHIDLEMNLVALDHVLHLGEYLNKEMEESADVLKEEILGKTTAIVEERLETLRKSLLHFSPYGAHSAPLYVEVHKKVDKILTMVQGTVAPAQKEKIVALKRLVTIDN